MSELTILGCPVVDGRCETPLGTVMLIGHGLGQTSWAIEICEGECLESTRYADATCAVLGADSVLSAIWRVACEAKLEAALRAYYAMWLQAAATVVDGEQAAWIHTGQPAEVWAELRARAFEPPAIEGAAGGGMIRGDDDGEPRITVEEIYCRLHPSKEGI